MPKIENEVFLIYQKKKGLKYLYLNKKITTNIIYSSKNYDRKIII